MKKKAKSAPCQRHVSESAELEGGGVFSGKKNFYKGVIQTKFFTGGKPKLAQITGG